MNVKVALTLALLCSPLHAGQDFSTLMDRQVKLHSGEVHSSRFVNLIVSHLRELESIHPKVLRDFYTLCTSDCGPLPDKEAAEVLKERGLIEWVGKNSCQIRVGVPDIVCSCMMVRDGMIKFQEPYDPFWWQCIPLKWPLINQTD